MDKTQFDNIGCYLDTLKKTIDDLRSSNCHANFILQNRIIGLELFKYFTKVTYDDVLDSMEELDKQNKLFDTFCLDIKKMKKYKKYKMMNYFSLVEIESKKQLNNEEIVSFFNEQFTNRVAKLESSLRMPKFIITRPHFSEPLGNKQFALGWLGIENQDEMGNVKKVNLSFRNKFLRKYGDKIVRHVSTKQTQYLWNDIFDGKSDIVKVIKEKSGKKQM